MSRSFKKTPKMAICGNASAKYDKQLANRGVRRAIKHSIRLSSQDYEEFLPPHRLECSHNQVYAWNRDGHQKWMGLTHKDWYWHTLHSSHPGDPFECWPPTYYLSLMRK